MAGVTIADVGLVLDAMNIHYHIVNENRCEFIIRVDNEMLNFSSFHVCILSERDTLSITLCPLGFRVKQSAFIHTLKLCHLINNEICTGYFNIIDNGSVGYVYTQFITKDSLTSQLIDDILGIAVFSWVTFADSIIPIMLGFSDKPNDAFKYCVDNYYKNSKSQDEEQNDCADDCDEEE